MGIKTPNYASTGVRTPNYDFAGPWGALGISVLAPAISYLLYFGCNEYGCPPYQYNWEQYIKAATPTFDQLYSTEVLIAFLAYCTALIVARFVLPGRTSYGVKLNDGSRLWYKHNALETFVPLLSVCGYMTYTEGWEWWVWQYIWDHYLQLLTAANLTAFALAWAVYLGSFRSSKPILAHGGDTGNIVYDWFIGRELNPRAGSFDIKVFAELRPGLMGWVILNLAFAAHQYTTHGYISDSMILVNIFQFWYVLDSLINEPAILTTMDVTTDGFGYMLSFGDLVWVPFTYSLQGRYLAMFPVDLGVTGVVGVLAVKAIGYWIFRGANGQKNKFRTNPNDPSLKHLKYIETKAGSRLLITGWWGMARHINYLGDWIMGISWCLPTAFRTWMTYFYVGYFAVLLIHRERRDEAKCKEKYGADWKKYTDIVRSRIVPGVY